MLHWIMTTGLQNVVESNHVALDVGIRVGNGVTNASLGTQIDHNIRVILLKNAVDKRLVCKVALDKCIVLEILKFRKARFLDANVVIIVHVIQTDDLSIRLSSQDTIGKVRANETGRSSNENCFIHFNHTYPFLHTILLTTFTYPLNDANHLHGHGFIHIVGAGLAQNVLLLHLNSHIRRVKKFLSGNAS